MFLFIFYVKHKFVEPAENGPPPRISSFGTYYRYALYLYIFCFCLSLGINNTCHRPYISTLFKKPNLRSTVLNIDNKDNKG